MHGRSNLHGTQEWHRKSGMKSAGGSERQGKNRDVDALQGEWCKNILPQKEIKRQLG